MKQDVSGFLIDGSIIVIGAVCMLSPVALIWSGFYSHTKRFTPLCHYALGSVLGLAPIAGWLAVSPLHLGYPAVLLFFGVTLWVAGFDILYACQDAEFDKRQGLFSLPARQGVPRALFTAALTHACTAVLFPMFGSFSTKHYLPQKHAGWVI